MGLSVVATLVGSVIVGAIFLYFLLAAYCTAMSLAGRSEQVHADIVQVTLILFEVSSR